MRKIVLDASVAAKWLFPTAIEPFSEKAVRLLEECVSREIEVLVPDLFWVEMSSVLWNAARTGRCSAEHASESFDRLMTLDFPTVPSLGVLHSAFEIACASGRTVYDCLYVALAEASGSEFITADEKIVNSLASRYSITWLGRLYNRS